MDKPLYGLGNYTTTTVSLSLKETAKEEKKQAFIFLYHTVHTVYIGHTKGEVPMTLIFGYFVTSAAGPFQ